MTPQDLQTCRAWCAANGVEVIEHPSAYPKWWAVGMPDWAIDYKAHSESDVLELIWDFLTPIIQSVRNLDAVEVEGPYKACESVSGLWFVQLNGLSIAARLPEQTARTIANLLNRECGDGK